MSWQQQQGSSNSSGGSNNEKKSLLVSINNPNRPGSSSNSGGYDSLSTIATHMTLPLNTSSALNNTLMGEKRHHMKRPAPKFREPSKFELPSDFGQKNVCLNICIKLLICQVCRVQYIILQTSVKQFQIYFHFHFKTFLS